MYWDITMCRNFYHTHLKKDIQTKGLMLKGWICFFIRKHLEHLSFQPSSFSSAERLILKRAGQIWKLCQ